MFCICWCSGTGRCLRSVFVCVGSTFVFVLVFGVGLTGLFIVAVLVCVGVLVLVTVCVLVLVCEGVLVVVCVGVLVGVAPVVGDCVVSCLFVLVFSVGWCSEFVFLFV